MARPDWLTMLDEWKECRGTIARLDSVIADLRKYGFSLVTALITAVGFLGQQKASPAVMVTVPVAIMILIVALFAIDRYYTLLLNAAVERTLDLEGPKIDRKSLINDTLTQVISVNAITSLSVFIAPLLYIGLLVAARILASAQGTHESEVNATFWVGLALIAGYFVYTEVWTKTGFFRRTRMS